MKWTKTGRAVYENGEATTYYQSDDGRFIIESRKRKIPHRNRSGEWMHTSYFLIDETARTETEYMLLSDAKEAAEKRMSNGRTDG